MKAWLKLGAVALAAGWLLAAKSEAGTSDVYRLQTLMKGVTQWDLRSNPGIPRTAAVQIRDVDLINLGLGQPLTNKVPATEHLALVTQCESNDMRIIVYDTTTSRNLVTIGNLQTVSVIDSRRGNRYTRNVISALTFTNLIAELTFTNLVNVSAGAVSNGLAGGTFYAAGSILSDSNQCFISYHANILGELDGSFFFTNSVVTNIVDITVTNTITNTYLVVSNFAVNVSSTTVTAGGTKLGTLIEP